MAYTAEDVNTYMTAANAAVATSDWSTAIAQATIALGCLAGIPADASVAGISMSWNHSTIQAFIDNCRRQQQTDISATGSGGIQQSVVEFTNPTT